LIDRRFRRTHIGRGAIGVQFFGASLGTIRRARVTGGRRPGLFVTILAGRTCLGSPLQPRCASGCRRRSPNPQGSALISPHAARIVRGAVDFLPENACLAAQNVSGLPGIGQSRSGLPRSAFCGSGDLAGGVAYLSAGRRHSLCDTPYLSKRSARPSSE
jgi:hypothetical protein